MIRSRLGLKALLLSGLVLGLMAFSASAAQALPVWMVNGADLNNNTLLPEVGGELETTSTLLFTTKGGTAVAISCTAATVTEAKLKEAGKTTESRVKFSGCSTKLNGTLSSKCEPFTGASKGVIETNKGLILIVLDAGVAAALVEPETGETLVTIALGETCAIGESVPVTGELFLKDCQNEFATEKVIHLVEQLLSETLKALGQPANLDGSAFIFLKGAHLNAPWSGLPA